MTWQVVVLVLGLTWGVLLAAVAVSAVAAWGETERSRIALVAALPPGPARAEEGS